MEEVNAAPRFGWVGGALCLDFTNTVGNHRSLDPAEKLNRFEDLVRWCADAGILQPVQQREVLKRGSVRPGAAARLLKIAVEFRESLYRIFLAVSLKQRPERSDMNILNHVLAQAPMVLEVQRQNHSFCCVRTSSLLDEAKLLGPIAWSAAELLTSEQLSSLRECAGEACGWLFLDLSKNHSRRWCAMNDCGGREKARRYYQRKKSSESSSSR
jgi:predicted RNA-binding Zn ribbon-like protein